MNSDEYHAPDLDEDSTNYMVCKFCQLPWGDHERLCPYGEPDGYDDPVARGIAEDRAYADLREKDVYGP